jgi:hypothetical protein|tara:strand:- start:330 stop:1724 length:1395 start_codon:yes stop_codon:yes gene_type:complete
MKSLQEQYNLITEGKGHKDVFMKDAKSRYPNLLNNSLNFDNTTKILKNKGIINENVGGYVDLKPITKIDSLSKKENWENKFKQFLNEKENPLQPLINDDKKVNTKEEEEKIKADSKKVSKSVENIESRNYDYDTNVENINNVNAQELLNGVYYESKSNPELGLKELQELAIKNLVKDPLHYVKEGQFGVGVGYEQPKTEVVDGDHAASGYSEKLKEGSDQMEPIKESLDKLGAIGGVVTTGNSNSLAAMSGEVIRQMMAEAGEFKADEAGSQYHNSLYAENEVKEDEGTNVSYKDTDVALDEKKDHDGDGDIDSDDYLAARDKAIKRSMAKKKPKKENIETKLAEIGKAAEITKMEAQLEFLHDHIDEKINRLSSIQEDENLKELVDKKKMKDMQKEIKLLEKRKAKMEKLYEKHCGKKFSRKEMVDEMDAVSWNEKNNPTRGAAGERDPKKVGQSTSAYAVNK